MKFQNVLETLECNVECDHNDNFVIWFLSYNSDWSAGIWGGQCLKQTFQSRQELINFVESNIGELAIKKEIRNSFDSEIAEDLINDLMVGW